ncbi:flagellar hook-associated protein FlgL [Accumulibacter sp.]|uniref:flagellar hook-associated protein FlgL n=1 Tax=Accumulibacter sp. TaxID=2053492 RepID=UPI0025E85081|nr:flagellar hook-associated protein FlgL [Accumulibacter sp.]MCM8596246.1 flagellar hook-associated protein FlgL [Accumulibacter sp.]MCM8627177.1 flagellar hook-associated protein FlgL [Accumulibacter sp.]MDS4050395.1 flagellar hook-associated protein FlgL [Accumulibacter sp.]
MRISTAQIHASALLGMERNQSQLLRVQNQLASGRRLLTPSDDPLASAKALGVSQARDVAAQYARNQGDASDRLGLVDGQLDALTELLQGVRARTVQAGNTVLTDSDRQAMASEVEERFAQLLGIANSRSAQGDYLFSGYQGSTAPFALAAATAAAGNPPVAYSGDDGERLLQVSATQQMPVSVAGSDLFMNIREGNGTFVSEAGGQPSALPNQGTAAIDAGSVVDRQRWQKALNVDFPWQGSDNHQLEIRFSVSSGVTSYQIFDASTPAPPAAPLSPRPVSAVLPYASGQAISLLTVGQPPAAPTSVDFGAQVVITGSPASGDSFKIRPSGQRSMFQTLQDLIGLLRTPLASGSDRSAFSSRLQGLLGDLDAALSNVSQVQSAVGARLSELDALASDSANLDVAYQQLLSSTQDLDYAQAISEFTRQQAGLEAAQKSFVAVSGLSLFQYI